MNARGITLLELLACLAVIGVLVAAAVPLHRAVITRARRTDARETLLAVQALQERHYFAEGRYAGNLDGLDAGTAPRRSSQGWYAIDLEASGDGQEFIARATAAPGSPQVEDAQCRELSLDHAGRRNARGTGDTSRCWD